MDLIAEPLLLVFSNSLIADQIGSFLSVLDLKSCCLVAKNWSESFTKQLRKQQNVVLKNLNDIRQLNQHPDVKYHRRPNSQLVFKFKLMHGLRMNYSLRSLWSVHGQGLTHLKLENVLEISGRNLQDILFLQNLKSLIIDNCFKGIGNGNRVLQQIRDTVERKPSEKLYHLELIGVFKCLGDKFVKDALSAFLKLYKNVEILKLGGQMFRLSDCNECLSKILDPILEARKTNPKIYRLKELDVINIGPSVDKIEMPFVKSLENLQYSLTALTLDIGFDTDKDVVAEILKLFQNSLKEIKIFRPRRDRVNCCYDDFPFGIQLESLKSLHMSDFVSNTIKFVKWTPKLEVLCIYGHFKKDEKSRALWPPIKVSNSKSFRHFRDPANIIERSDLDAIDRKVVTSLKEFSFAFRRFSKDMKTKLSLWMPDVKINWMVEFVE